MKVKYESEIDQKLLNLESFAHSGVQKGGGIKGVIPNLDLELILSQHLYIII